MSATMLTEPTQITVIPNRLHWRGVPMSSKPTAQLHEYSYHGPGFNYQLKPKSVSPHYVFTTDLDICYQAFAKDFGPLNLAVIWRYCKLMQKVFSETNNTLEIIHETNSSELLRHTNSIFLICAYGIVCENMTAADVYRPFKHLEHTFIPFRDASACVSMWPLKILDCLEALECAIKLKWFDYENFDIEFYEHYEKVESGDLNWIVPEKFMAFATPHNRSRDVDGYKCWTPDDYSPLFHEWKIGTVVRLNKPSTYDRTKFIKRNIKHLDLYFNDGGLPTPNLVDEFLRTCETEPNAVAVHCKAGLGRTGTLIGCYVMKHFKMPARLWIAWNRLTRPGSILGPQQQFMCDMEAVMFARESNSNIQVKRRVDRDDPIEVINVAHTMLNTPEKSSLNKVSYAAKMVPKSLNMSNPYSYQDPGQGEWLLSQKRNRQAGTTAGNRYGSTN